MVVQGISYMTNPTYEDVMSKVLTENQRMAIWDWNSRQEEALLIYIRPQTPNYFGGYQFKDRRRGYGYSRPNVIFSNSIEQAFELQRETSIYSSVLTQSLKYHKPHVIFLDTDLNS